MIVLGIIVLLLGGYIYSIRPGRGRFQMACQI